MMSRYEVRKIESRQTKSGYAWAVYEEDVEIARYKNPLAAAMRVLKEEHLDAVIENEEKTELKEIWQARIVRV